VVYDFMCHYSSTVIGQVDDANATQQKEYAMALSVVLTLQVPQVIDKLDDILSVCTTVIIGSREVKTNDDTRYPFVLHFNMILALLNL